MVSCAMDGYFSTFFCAITKKEDTCGAPYSKDEKIEFSFGFFGLKNCSPYKKKHLSISSLLYTAQLKTCCINRHVVPFCEIQAALEDTLSFQHKKHA